MGLAQTVTAGSPLTLSVVTTGATGFQWLKNGEPIQGATNPVFSLASASGSDSGNYSVRLTNASGSITSTTVSVIVNASRIVNLSIRSSLGSAAPMLTVGFVVSGQDKRLLVRGIGPGLSQFGLEGVLADPRMALYAGDRWLSANDNWGTAANAFEVSTTAAQVGAFPLGGGSADAALLSNFDGGSYSVQVTGPAASSGMTLVELYDANAGGAARLVNVSTRAQVGTADDVLMAGFVISGEAPKTLLIRAAGPTLATFGIDGTLANPRLDVLRMGEAAPLASNDDWAGTAELTAAFVAQGAFPFAATGSKDAALFVTLQPGNYSARVSGVGETTGEALLEIYDVR